MKVDRITHSRDMVIRIFQDGGRPNLGFGTTGSRSIRSTVPEKPTLGSNTKSIGSPVAEIWPFEILQNARSVGRSLVLNITLFSYTPLRYVRNVAREE